MNTPTLTTDMFITRNDADLLVTITGKPYRGNPRDYADPDEMDEMDDITATADGRAVELSEAEEEAAGAKLAEVRG